jgi:hypothetical protein
VAVSSTAPARTVGDHGEPCASCGAPLAADQRYCLECGERRAQLAPPRPPATVADLAAPERPAAAPHSAGWPPGAGLAAGIAVLLLAMGVGVLIGKAGKSGSGSAAAPSVVTVAQPGATAAATPAAFQADWPSGKSGWTVALQTLPKAGTQPAAVAAAKTAATGKGAGAVGALDEDSYASLDGGSYLVYSGVFDTKAQASVALKGLKGRFPGARVVQVSSGGGGSGKAAAPKKTVSKQQLNKLDKLSPQQYQKQSKNLPKTLGTPGKAPPKDNKTPGGGSGSTEIG